MGAEGWGPGGVGGQTQKKWGFEGGSKGGGAKGGAPKGGGPKFRVFFFPLPPKKSFFSSSLGVFSWIFGTDFGQFWCSVFWRNFQVLLLLVFCCVVCCCVVVVLLCPTPEDTNPEPCPALRGPTCSGFGAFVLGCCGCCWFGLPWTTFRRSPPSPPDRPKFRAFSSLSRHHFALSVSLRVSSRFGWCFEVQVP